MSTLKSHLPHRRREERDVPTAPGFRNGRQPRPSDVFIAVMGITGAGKSSFIATCSGKMVKIGADLQACTSHVDVFAYEMTPDRTIYLIDTPGFDDTNRSDTQVLTEIARWLGDSYRSQVLLHGIIYLHRIADVRMVGSAKKNLLMFRQLCGDDYLKKVILVTTMWDKVEDSVGARRERELRETPDFWGSMVSKGSVCYRYYNEPVSGKEIIHKLASHDCPTATGLQKELVDESRELGQTAAGQEIEGELRKQEQKWAQEKRKIEKGIKEAKRQHDREAEQMMREERDRYTGMMKKIEEDSGALRATMENLLAQRDVREAQMKDEMKRQRQAHKDDLKRLNKKQKDLERQTAELKSQQKRDEEARKKAVAKQQDLERETAKLKSQKKRDEEARKKAITTQQQPVQAQAVQPESSANAVYAPYSLSVFGTHYAFIGPNRIMRNSAVNPDNRLGSAFLDASTVGENGQWIVRYTDKQWCWSYTLANDYPHLANSIADLGLNNLEFCVLGPNQMHYARWLHGGAHYLASDEMNAQIKKHSREVRALAFGYGNAFFLSFGSGKKRAKLGWESNLKGYYPTLYSWLDENRSASIIAITLDPHTPGNYVIVYYRAAEESGYYIRWYWSDNNIHSAIRNWWGKSGG